MPPGASGWPRHVATSRCRDRRSPNPSPSWRSRPPKSILARARTVIGTNLAALERLIAAHSATLAWVKPAGGTTAFPWFTDGRDARPFAEMLARKGVLVTPGDCFGPRDHFRVGLGAEPAEFSEALLILSHMLDAGNQ